jgi:hypothetical protein
MPATTKGKPATKPATKAMKTRATKTTKATLKGLGNPRPSKAKPATKPATKAMKIRATKTTKATLKVLGKAKKPKQAVVKKTKQAVVVKKQVPLKRNRVTTTKTSPGKKSPPAKTSKSWMPKSPATLKRYSTLKETVSGISGKLRAISRTGHIAIARRIEFVV